MKDGDYFRVTNEKSKYFNCYGIIIRLGLPGRTKCMIVNINEKEDMPLGSLIEFDLSELIIANDEIETYKLLNS